MKHRMMPAMLALGLSAVLATDATAGKCPADKVLKTPRTIEKVTDGSKVKDEVVETVDPAGWRGVKGLMLRTRRLVIAPGGLVPTHSHSDRPAIIYVISGQIIEHNTLCSVPIVHKAGEATGEFGELQHWWENKGKKPVVLTSSDLVPVEMMNDPMMKMP